MSGTPRKQTKPTAFRAGHFACCAAILRPRQKTPNVRTSKGQANKGQANKSQGGQDEAILAP
jgi:hypothetical protein